MKSSVFVFDPTVNDKQSRIRGIGRYLQILRENFSEKWNFINKPLNTYHLTPNGVFINPFFNFLQPPLFMRRVAPKQIAVIHDLIPLKYPEHFPVGIRGNINIFLNKLALKNYDTIVAVSEAVKKDIVQILNIPPDKIKVVYSCLPKIFSNSKFKIENLKLNENWKLKIENSFCLYVGDSTWNKNLVNLAKAIQIINVTCVFVGKVFDPLKNFQITKNRNCRPLHSEENFDSSNNWISELNDFIRLTKNNKRFIFAGFLPDQELIKLYQQAKVNILISRDEGFGFSFIESANFDCPSVLADIPVLKEIAGSNYPCFANPNDPNDIANKIGELYFNNDLRNKIGSEAHQRAKHFSQNNFINSWRKLFVKK